MLGLNFEEIGIVRVGVDVGDLQEEGCRVDRKSALCS